MIDASYNLVIRGLIKADRRKLRGVGNINGNVQQIIRG